MSAPPLPPRPVDEPPRARAGRGELTRPASAARVAAQASLDRLGRSGVTVGALDEDRLSDRQGVGRRPFYHALCRDDATQVSGFFGITATVDEAAGRILILGFTAPVLEDTAAVERARSRLMDMVEHLRLAPAAATTPNR